MVSVFLTLKYIAHRVFKSVFPAYSTNSLVNELIILPERNKSRRFCCTISSYFLPGKIMLRSLNWPSKPILKKIISVSMERLFYVSFESLI
jgi:hypothetical protein